MHDFGRLMFLLCFLAVPRLGTAATCTVTINIEAEPDPGLANAAVSTVVISNIPIVVERSMDWDASGVLFKGGTNATGVRLP